MVTRLELKYKDAGGVILRNKRINDQGFSLMELLISVAILSVIILPLLNNFVAAAKISVKARRMQNETILSQNILEGLKTEEFNEEFFDRVEIEGSTYLLKKKDLSGGNRKYDALITINPGKYITDIPEGGEIRRIGYNTFRMPIIPNLNEVDYAIAKEDDKDDLAVDALYDNHNWHIRESGGTSHTKEEIRDDLRKEIKININKVSGSTTLTCNVDYIYTSPATLGAGEVVNHLVENQIINPDAGGVYIFYKSSKAVEVEIMNGPDNNDIEVDIYLVLQGDGDAAPDRLDLTYPIGSISNKINIYSNADIVDVVMNKLVKKEAMKDRIYDIKVELFEAGKNFNTDYLCTQVITTKGD